MWQRHLGHRRSYCSSSSSFTFQNWTAEVYLYQTHKMPMREIGQPVIEPIKGNLEYRQWTHLMANTSLSNIFLLWSALCHRPFIYSELSQFVALFADAIVICLGYVFKANNSQLACAVSQAGHVINSVKLCLLVSDQITQATWMVSFSAMCKSLQIFLNTIQTDYDQSVLFYSKWRSSEWTQEVSVHGVDDWDKGTGSGGLQATGRSVWESHFLTFLQQEKQQTRENKRAGNEQKQIKVSDTDRTYPTSYMYWEMKRG